MNFKHTVLDNGLTVIGEESPSALSMAAGYFVRTGARDETPEINGVSHFLEHMLFKGTPHRSAEAVNREFDEMGADYNAFTGDEYTVYYGAVLPEHQHRLVDLLTDLMRPSLREDDFNVEKEVIREEIKLYKDRPQFTVMDEVRSTYYAGHPLGYSVLGTDESIVALKRDQMHRYWSRRYAPNNLILTLTGAFDWEAALREVRQATREWSPAESPRETPPFRPEARVKVMPDAKITRAHLSWMTPGVPAQSDERFAADIVGDVIGGGEGSRLFWELVHPGIADSASMSHNEEDGSGVFQGYASCDPERAQEVVDRIRSVFGKAEAEGLTEGEIERSKRKIASALVLHDETPRGRLFHLGFDWQYRQKYVPIDEVIDRYLAVTVDDARRFLERRPFEAMTMVGLGPLESLS